MDADHTILVMCRFVGAEPYWGSRARRYAQVTRERPSNTPMAASLVRAMWRVFDFGFWGGGAGMVGGGMVESYCMRSMQERGGSRENGRDGLN